MSVNQLEATLQAVTHTLAKLEKEGCNDEKLLNELRKERDKLLNELNLNWFLNLTNYGLDELFNKSVKMILFF